MGCIRFDDLGWEQGHAKWPAYAQSKPANLMFALELARRLQVSSRQIIGTAVHPGYAATGLQMAGPHMANSALDKLLESTRRASTGMKARDETLGTGPTESQETGRVRFVRRSTHRAIGGAVSRCTAVIGRYGTVAAMLPMRSSWRIVLVTMQRAGTGSGDYPLQRSFGRRGNRGCESRKALPAGALSATPAGL